jgi:AraC family transcriptional activator of pyochelin receptor
MEYSITHNEIGQFYNYNYATDRCNNAFSSKCDKISTDVLDLSINEWRTPELKTHLIQTQAQRDIQILGGAKCKAVILHFVCNGTTAIADKQTHPSIIKRNANNVFCATDNDVKHAFRKGENNIYFKVFLPYSYINTKIEQYPDIFGVLSSMINNQCPVLREGNIATTLEMKTVINQIRNAQTMGALAPIYFETKIQELLVLQLQQMQKYTCPDCKYHTHYQEQLNEARNRIENNYQTPPTIAQLAQEVGMSETVLKTNFKNCFGNTIYGYLFEYRMHIARKLLQETTLTIAEIAERSGYEYASHFTTAFKRKFGVSPVEYRGQA